MSIIFIVSNKNTSKIAINDESSIVETALNESHPLN